MSTARTYQALNRLLTILYRSLPTYLTWASPWTDEGEAQSLETVRRIAADQKQLSTRVAQFILDHHGPIEIGEYCTDFYDFHDLSLDYLSNVLVQYQKADVVAIEKCVAELQGDRAAAALAEEALGAARGHLESFEELAGRVTKTAS